PPHTLDLDDPPPWHLILYQGAGGCCGSGDELMGGGDNRLFAVMAHPDDIVILSGGTLLHLRSEGWELVMVTMTAGDCGSSRARTSEEIARIRYEEARSAADSIGAWYGCAGLQDAEVFANKGSIRKTVELIRDFAPDV